MIDIIPAIDLIDGKCVRLTQGDFARKKEYSADPLEVARRFEDHGLRRLHLVDLDGAREGRVVQYKILEKIATRTGLQIDFGGGMQSDDDARIAFECGAQQITGGSVAVKDRERFLGWLDRYGAERIILGVDARDGKIAIDGWQTQTVIEAEAILAGYQAAGMRHVIFTDIGRDGALQGPAIDTYRVLRERFPDLQLIASGGVATVADLERLAELGLAGAIIGKALYEGKIQLTDLQAFLMV